LADLLSASAENFRLIRQAEQIIGGLAVYHLGQYNSERANGAAVGIAPEHRGTGAAVELFILSKNSMPTGATFNPLLLLSALTGKWDMNKAESLQLGTPK